MKFCLYYSLYEWFNPMYLHDKKEKFKTQEFIEALLESFSNTVACDIILQNRTAAMSEVAFAKKENLICKVYFE